MSWYLSTIKRSYRKIRIEELESRIMNLCHILERDKDTMTKGDKEGLMYMVVRIEEEIRYLKKMNNLQIN